jgi:hypothetical protein
MAEAPESNPGPVRAYCFGFSFSVSFFGFCVCFAGGFCCAGGG